MGPRCRERYFYQTTWGLDKPWRTLLITGVQQRVAAGSLTAGLYISPLFETCSICSLSTGVGRQGELGMKDEDATPASIGWGAA